jgi:hypothetical protein
MFSEGADQNVEPRQFPFLKFRSESFHACSMTNLEGQASALPPINATIGGLRIDNKLIRPDPE